MSNKTLTVLQLLTQFGLNWTAEKKPFFFRGNDGKELESDYFGLIRSDNEEVLGHCKGSYFAFQNQMILEAMKKFADENNLEIVKGGAFGGGKKTFLQMKISDTLKIGNDSVEEYIFAANSFDHSCKLSFGYTNIVVSCQNSFNKMMKNDIVYKFKHTQSAEEKVLEVPNLFASHFKLRQETNEMFHKWESTPLTKDMAADLINYLMNTDRMPTAKEREEMATRSINILEGLELSVNKEIKEKGDNLWGLFNGITYYVNYLKSYPQRDNGQLESVLVGTGHKMMNKAFNYIENNF